MMDMGNMMGQGMGPGGYGSAWSFGPVLWILLLAVIALAVYYALKREGGVKLKDKEIAIGAVAIILLLGLGGGMGAGMGFGLIFWVLIIALVYYLIAGKDRINMGETPVEILDKRYAKGEITREEYLRMKEEIIKK